MPVRSWILLGFPLLWAGPLALSFSVLRVHMTAAGGGVAAGAAWVAALAPIVGAVLAVMNLRPIGWLSALWMLLNSLLGLMVFAFIVLMAFQT